MATPGIHTPYDGTSRPFTIGLKPLDEANWIDIDEHFERYVTEKRRLYDVETGNVLVAEPDTLVAQAEVLTLVRTHLAAHFPHLPRQAETHLGDLAQASLLIQDDLVLMRKSENGWRLAAASVCFPSAWNLNEKFGKPLGEVHAPVPGFATGTRNAQMIERMFDNLSTIVLRWNWSLYGDDRLYFPASHNGMKSRFGEGTNIEGRVMMRLERQTLRKLPETGDILFAIRIYINPLEVLERHPDGAQLAKSIAAQLESMSDQEVSYKGLQDERERLLDRLSMIHQR